MGRTGRLKTWFGVTALSLALLAAPGEGTAPGERSSPPAAGGGSPADQEGHRPTGHGGCGSLAAEGEAVKVLPADHPGFAPGLLSPARHCLRRGPWSGPDLSSRRISST